MYLKTNAINKFIYLIIYLNLILGPNITLLFLLGML